MNRSLSLTDLASLRPEQLRLPDVKLPQVKLPEVKLPQVKLSDVKLPDVKLPEVKLPEFPRPDLARVGRLAEDAAYIAVGLGVLGVQRLQVRRRELERALRRS